MRPQRILAAAMLCLAALGITPHAGQCQTAIGKWRDCLDYSTVSRVEPAGEYVYAAARSALFRYDTHYGTIDRMSKTTGMSDAGISTIAYDPTTGTLVVAYSNANIDLVQGERVYNLSDIKRSDISGSKTLSSIRFDKRKAYVGTGFGIVVIDLDRHEIKETLYIGEGGGYTSVVALAATADSLYASTTEGLKRIALSESHMSISDRWETDHRWDTLHVALLDTADGQLIVGAYSFDPQQLTLYRQQADTIAKWNEGIIHSVRSHAGRIDVAHETSIAVYDTHFQLIDSLTHYEWGELMCNDAVHTADGVLWAGHEWSGLIALYPDGHEDYLSPAGPASADNTYRLVGHGYKMFLCPGGHTSVFANAYMPANLFYSNGYTWKNIDQSSGLIDGTFDVVDVAIDPADSNHWMAALWGYGVCEIKDNSVVALHTTSSTDGALQPYTTGYTTTLRTGAVQYDRMGRLWVLLSHSSSTLACQTRDGQWHGYNTTPLSLSPAVDKLVCDSLLGYLWFSGRDNLIYVHDGENRMARVDPNNGSKLQTDAVTAIVQDRSGNIWVGTNKGIKVIYDGYRAFQNGGSGEVAPVSCSNITITNGEFYEYLMAYESITAIAVDGANRKWVGTSTGGLYLISANGLEQLQHFTESNSPLLSNKIVSIGIQPRTGEVYIGTDRGLQVYRSTATYADAELQYEVHAYPNPVRPDYDGTIAIEGFTRDALVHITDAAGHTVYTTRALGGQAIWNGRTLGGERVASGTYFIFAADSEGGHRAVGKILIVR